MAQALPYQPRRYLAPKRYASNRLTWRERQVAPTLSLPMELNSIIRGLSVWATEGRIAIRDMPTVADVCHTTIALARRRRP